jgi:hypothetical protein
VEAGSLLANAVQLKVANADQHKQTAEMQMHRTDKHIKQSAASAAGLSHEVLDQIKKSVWGVRRVRRPGNSRPPKPRKAKEKQRTMNTEKQRNEAQDSIKSWNGRPQTRPETLWRVAMCLLTLAGSLQVVHAATYVCGDVWDSWTKANSPYVATCDLIVPGGQTLTIQPGVTVKLIQGCKMTVNGNLVANGTPTERITICGTSPSVYWDQIDINYGGGAQSSFVNCDISGATNAVFFHVYSLGVPLAPQFIGCTFSNCLEACILGGATAWAGVPDLRPLISSCRFINSSNGVHMVSDGAKANPTIANNLFIAMTGKAHWFEVGYYGISAPSNPKTVNNVFHQCATALTKTGSSPSLNDEISYNCLYNNQTNFVGYPPGGYGAICCVNARGTNCDLANNIFVDPLFCETTSYTLSASSPCIDAGNPDAAYLDSCIAAGPCQPGSLGTTLNDIGAWGGPHACDWIKPPATNFLVAARSYPGVTIYPPTPGHYHLEYIDSLAKPPAANGPWTQVTNLWLLSTPWTWIDYNAPTTAKRFYRAVLLQ